MTMTLATQPITKLNQGIRRAVPPQDVVTEHEAFMVNVDFDRATSFGISQLVSKYVAHTVSNGHTSDYRELNQVQATMYIVKMQRFLADLAN